MKKKFSISKWWDDYSFHVMVVVSILVLIYIYFRHNGDVGKFRTEWNIKIPDKIVKVRKGCKKKHEVRCREILEELYYPHRFPSVRPNFLKNPTTGKNLEIDCYNDVLRVGLEYQGIQHRKYTPWFHKSVDDFNYQVEKDIYKKNKCQELGIKMIYVPDTVKFKNLKQYILTNVV